MVVESPAMVAQPTEIHNNHCLIWTEEEIDFLRKFYPDPYLTVEDIQEKIPWRTINAIYNKATRLDVDKKSTFSSDEKIPIYYNDIENHILLSNDENIKKNTRADEYAIFSRFEKIAKNQGAIKAYKHFLQRGASFAKELAKSCQYSLATAYRALETLQDLDLIKPLTILSVRKASGPAPTLYGLKDSTKEEEIKAGNRYLKSKRKTYKHVQQIVQLTLQEARNQEIQFKKICFIAKNNCSKHFYFMDLAEQAALELKELDITVWR